MRTNRAILAAVASASAVVLTGCGGSGSSVQQPPTIKFVTVKDITPQGITDGGAVASITSNGHVLAWDTSGIGIFDIYNGTSTQLDPTETVGDIATGINNSGEVVGYHPGTLDSTFEFHDGILSALGIADSVIGVLDNGGIVTANGFQIQIYDANSSQTVAFPQMIYSLQVFGNEIVTENSSHTTAYRYDGSKIVALKSPASNPNLAVNGVNSDGYAVGASFYVPVDPPVAAAGNRAAQPSSTGGPRPCLWSPTALYSELPIPTTLTSANASGINHSRVVVGTGYDANGNAHAVIWKNGSVQDITPLLPAGVSVVSVNGIDDAGEILMLASDSQKQTHVILAMPTT